MPQTQPKTYEWGFAPRSAYQCEYRGERVGLGLSPVFDAVPGAWNLVQLSSTVLDNLLPWTDDPGNFPVWIGAVPSAVATALQMHSTGLCTVGELAAISTPRQFLACIQGRDDLITARLLGKAWWDLAEERASALEPFCTGHNLIRVDFTGRRLVH